MKDTGFFKPDKNDKKEVEYDKQSVIEIWKTVASVDCLPKKANIRDLKLVLLGLLGCP